MRQRAGPAVTLLGNLPPRDVLAAGTPDDVRKGVRAMMKPMPDLRRVVLSCGGGLPPGVPTANLEAFIAAARTSGDTIPDS
jgi:uroporphyrinogen decarboxylase